ncbi:jg18634 [Pararge aegeria aegeria]|uniref:Jg18634 protein n=1 Tax=Pararge aegeria aegeria TaxID=348720 RepID=A0A8S4RE74_9NEOP|nr:jg18634 [Pararge aegeria aegeria]
MVVAVEMNSMALGIIGSHGFPREPPPPLAVGSMSEAFHHSSLGERFHRICPTSWSGFSALGAAARAEEGREEPMAVE